MTSPHPDKRLLSIDEACHVLGLGRTSIYAAIKRADLKTLKYGRRTLILETEIEAFIGKLTRDPAAVNSDKAKLLSTNNER